MPRYPEYKSSGVDWLGSVPVHWETWKLRHAFGVIGSGTTPPSDESHWYDEGTIPWVTTGELRETAIYQTAKSVTPAAIQKFTTLKVHPKGALAIAMYGATIGRLGLLGVDAATNQACCVLSMPRSLDVRFVFYWLYGFKQRIIDLFATGGGQPNINQETISSLRIPAPNLPEQTAIATFLDRETGKIDVLIAEQEKLLALLAEKRQATISHAVTKGLNPDVPMKDTGVAWLGEVPSHWDRVQLGRLCTQVSDGPHFSPNYVDDGVMFLSARNIKVDGWSLDDAKYVSEEDYAEFNKRVIPEKGDVLYTKGGTTGIAKVVDLDVRFQVWVHVAVLKLDKSLVMPHYVAFALNSIGCYEQSQLYTRGATNQDLGLTRMVKIFLALPPLEEQHSIISWLDAEIAKLDALKTESERAITLLKERRSALIAAAVTGQINVRGLVTEMEAA